MKQPIWGETDTLGSTLSCGIIKKGRSCYLPSMHKESNPESVKLVRLVKLDKREEPASGIEAVNLWGEVT